MQKKDIAIIAVRLLALYFILMTIYNLPDYLGVIHWLPSDDALGRAFLITHIIGAVIKFIIGIALWFYSSALAILITKDLPESSPPKKGFTLASIQAVAISLIGVFILSSAIPAFFEVIISYVFPGANPHYVRSLDIAGNKKVEIPITTLITVALKLGLGFWFLLGANGIVTAIREIWAKGRSI